jgi:hypothetical protein
MYSRIWVGINETRRRDVIEDKNIILPVDAAIQSTSVLASLDPAMTPGNGANLPQAQDRDPI